jgi:hypothetical protein
MSLKYPDKLPQYFLSLGLQYCRNLPWHFKFDTMGQCNKLFTIAIYRHSSVNIVL